MRCGLQVRVDDEMQILAFASAQDLQKFVRFVRTYQTDSGAGNGYGAYWVFDPEPVAVTDDARYQLDWKLINYMCDSVGIERTGEPLFTVNLGREESGIKFDFTFPERRTPKVGEMFRCIERRGDTPADLPKEGRVVAKAVDNLTVISCWDEADDGSVKEGARRWSVPSGILMWIPDWKKQRRDARASV